MTKNRIYEEKSFVVYFFEENVWLDEMKFYKYEALPQVIRCIEKCDLCDSYVMYAS